MMPAAIDDPLRVRTERPLVVADADGWPDDIASGEPAPTARTFPFWAVVLVWCIPALISMAQSATALLLIDRLQAEWWAVALQFPRWMAWAPLTPLIVRATRRFPFRAGYSARALAMHLLIAILMISAVELAWTYLSMLVEPTPLFLPRGVQLERWRPALAILGRLVIGLLTYATVVGIVIAFDSRVAIREHALRESRLEADLAKAQVNALKMQVHPHFLFNTLNAISVLIGSRPDVAREMIIRLGDLLRLTLSRAATAEVPLGEELGILRHYLEIERVRFGDRLSVNIEVEQGASGALVPHLVLQPLVENAIKHGVTLVEGAHEISVRARRIGHEVQIEVLDDGQGPPASVADGIGLHTVRERLDRLYGDAQSLRLEARPEGGCRTVVTLPFRAAIGIEQPHE